MTVVLSAGMGRRWYMEQNRTYVRHWERRVPLVESAYAAAETNRERESSSTRYSVEAKEGD